MQSKNMKKDETIYKLDDALKNIKGAKTKFDQTVEVHINLGTDRTKQEQNVRYTTTLPHGTGKSKKVAVLASKKVPNADLELMETDLEKIEHGEIKPKVHFDVLVSEPKFMPKLAKVARVLGPAGAMPNPKTGTVSENVEEAVAQIKKGKIEVKTEKDAAVIHTVIGKTSFSEDQLSENFSELMTSLKQNKPAKMQPDWIKGVALCTTQGRSYKVDFSNY